MLCRSPNSSYRLLLHASRCVLYTKTSHFELAWGWLRKLRRRGDEVEGDRRRRRQCPLFRRELGEGDCALSPRLEMKKVSPAAYIYAYVNFPTEGRRRSHPLPFWLYTEEAKEALSGHQRRGRPRRRALDASSSSSPALPPSDWHSRSLEKRVDDVACAPEWGSPLPALDSRVPEQTECVLLAVSLAARVA